MEYQTFVVTTRKGKNSISLCLNDFQFRQTYLLWKRGQSISIEIVMQFTEERVNKRFQAHRFLYCGHTPFFFSILNRAIKPLYRFFCWSVYIIFSFSFLSNGIFVQKANTLKIDKFKEIAFIYIWFLYYECRGICMRI
jgi:hypothetical protein